MCPGLKHHKAMVMDLLWNQNRSTWAVLRQPRSSQVWMCLTECKVKCAESVSLCRTWVCTGGLNWSCCQTELVEAAAPWRRRRPCSRLSEPPGFYGPWLLQHQGEHTANLSTSDQHSAAILTPCGRWQYCCYKTHLLLFSPPPPYGFLWSCVSPFPFRQLLLLFFLYSTSSSSLLLSWFPDSFFFCATPPSFHCFLFLSLLFSFSLLLPPLTCFHFP